MKSLVTLGLLLLANSASATSLYMGPFLSLEAGKRDEVGYRTCLITPSSVVKTEGEARSVETISLDADVFAAAIKDASTARQTRALHFMAAVPTITITAGDSLANVGNYQVAKDASDYVARTGRAADYLIALASRVCTK